MKRAEIKQNEILVFENSTNAPHRCKGASIIVSFLKVVIIMAIKVRLPNDDKARQLMAADDRHWRKVYQEYNAGKCPETKKDLALLICNSCVWKKRIDGERVFCNAAAKWLKVGRS
jgi:hypothetical protein